MNRTENGPAQLSVTRDGETFLVRDDARTTPFWTRHFGGSWESGTKAAVDRLVRGGTFVDIGAWIGPVSLWAQRRGAFVLAVEPDPMAYPHLHTNLTANGSRFQVGRLAVAAHDGTTRLGRRTDWGDSMSSITADDSDGVEVCCLTIESLLAPTGRSDIQLIKIDIEGGEEVVLPAAEPYLRHVGAPLCLSLHPYWWTNDPRPCLADWRCEPIGHDQALYFPPPT